MHDNIQDNLEKYRQSLKADLPENAAFVIAVLGLHYRSKYHYAYVIENSDNNENELIDCMSEVEEELLHRLRKGTNWLEKKIEGMIDNKLNQIRNIQKEVENLCERINDIKNKKVNQKHETAPDA